VSWYGIWFYHSHTNPCIKNNNVTGNIITNNYCGIYLKLAIYNNVTDNIITNNACGIRLDYSSNNIIMENKVSNNTQAIRVYYSSNTNTIVRNTINNSIFDYGIDLDSSNYNNITENIINNNRYGIRLYSSNGNTFMGNTITNNIRYGIRLESNSNDNLIYNNYFNNTYNAYDLCNNIWNIGKTPGPNIVGGPYLGGNFWHDYTGVDIDGDDLGDTLLPYTCSGNIISGGDHLPLVTNNPPGAPTITGPDRGKPGEEYDYLLIANDPDNDEFKFIIDFDDGTTLESDFMPNGEEIMVTYEWSSIGTYDLQVYAQDEHGLNGPVATLTVTMPKNKAVDTPFLNYFQNHPILFRLLQKIFQRL
jgi:parallel beta-helix repeat protein